MSTTSSSGKKDRYAGLARLLRTRRHELGKTRSEVADLAGLSYPYIAQLEGGYRAPSPSSVHGLAAALELPVEDLMGAAAQDAKPHEATRAVGDTGPIYLPNPAYANGIDAEETRSSGPTSRRSKPRTESADARTGQMVPAASSDISHAELGAVAEEVIRALDRLPPDSRLDALALAQSRVMKDVVREQVRRATED